MHVGKRSTQKLGDLGSARSSMLGRGREGESHTPVIYATEKSDIPIVSRKPPNKDRSAEEVEKRGIAKGSVEGFPVCRTQRRKRDIDETQQCT